MFGEGTRGVRDGGAPEREGGRGGRYTGVGFVVVSWRLWGGGGGGGRGR